MNVLQVVIKQFKTRIVGLQVVIIVIIRYISGNMTFREPSSRAVSAQYGVLALASLGPIHAVGSGGAKRRVG